MSMLGRSSGGCREGGISGGEGGAAGVEGGLPVNAWKKLAMGTFANAAREWIKE